MKSVRASKDLTVVQIDSNQFSVQSSTDENVLYIVFSDINMCECISGQGGAFCKHLCAVHEIFSNISIAPTLSTTDRINLAKIALGHLSKDDEQFFNNMTLPTTSDSLNKEVRENNFNADKSNGNQIKYTVIVVKVQTLTLNINMKLKQID